MTFTVSFPTPNPYGYADKVPATSTGVQGLMPLFFQSDPHQPSIVTPEYALRQTIYTGLASDESAKLASLILTKDTLATSKGVHVLSPRKQPSLVPRPVKAGTQLPGLSPAIALIPSSRSSRPDGTSGSLRLNKFVRRLHDMLEAEKDSGIVEWRRGLLVLYSTDAFAKKILPKYFNTRNFKTFRRQLNYYGFVHVRSFSTTGSSTTALWVNRGLAKEGTDDISSVLKLRRVEPCESAKTAEGRRNRKEMAISTVEEDIGVSAKTLQLEQIRSMTLRGEDIVLGRGSLPCLKQRPPIPREVHVPTDSSTSSYSQNSSLADSDDCNTAVSDDAASACAAHVLLMISRA